MTRIRALVNRLASPIKKIRDRVLGNRFVKFMMRVMNQMGEDNGTALAAAVAYYGFLSLFPFLLGLIAILGLFLPSQQVQEQILSYIQENLPQAADIIINNIQNVIQYRGALGIAAIVGLIWSGSAVMGVVDNAINRAWNNPKMLRFYLRKPREIGLTLAIGSLFLISIGATYLFSVLPFDDFPAAGVTLTQIASRLVAFAIIYLVFLILFKLMPNTRTYWRQIWPGALLTAIFFEIGRTIFVYYIDNFANYQLIYGSIGSVIAILVWIYYSAAVLIFGAELTAEHVRTQKRAPAVFPP